VFHPCADDQGDDDEWEGIDNVDGNLPGGTVINKSPDESIRF